MARLGMVIDLKRCIGCNACTIACKAEQATPKGVFWCRVLEREEGKYPHVKRIFLPVQCNHCQDAPCEKVCPTGATQQRPDGIVMVDYARCIGCRACMTACPYQVRFYGKEIQGYFPGGLTPFEEMGYKRFQPGTVQKCTFCVERVEAGLEPACVQTCPAKARYFGDLEDGDGEVARLIVERHAFRLRPEMGTEPSIYYLA